MSAPARRIEERRGVTGYKATALFVYAVLFNSVAYADLPPITEQRNAVVGFAWTVNLITLTLSNVCNTLGGDFTEKAKAARSQWKERNWTLADGAKKYFTYVKLRIAKQQGEEAASAFYDGQKAEFEKNANDSMNDFFPSGTADPKVCEKMLGAVTAGKFDFASQPERLKELKEIQADMDVVFGGK